MDPVEPQSANDYDNRTTAAVKSVLVEIGQILGSFEGKFAVIGGAVPWLLLSQAEMPHVGTADVDLDGKFRTVDDYGPVCVRRFVDGSPLLGQRTPDQWQQDAFGQVDAWLVRLGVR